MYYDPIDSLPPIANDPAAITERLWLKHYDPCLRLALFPTFSPPEIWFVFLPEVQLNPLPEPVVCQIWPGRDDIEPEIRSSSVPWTGYLNLMNGLGSIELRPFNDPLSDFRDGDRLILTKYGSIQSVELSWPGENSELYADLTHWFRTATDNLRALLARK